MRTQINTAAAGRISLSTGQQQYGREPSCRPVYRHYSYQLHDVMRWQRQETLNTMSAAGIRRGQDQQEHDVSRSSYRDEIALESSQKLTTYTTPQGGILSASPEPHWRLSGSPF